MAVWLAVPLGGCATLGYYAHSVNGHLALLASRRPLDEVLADPSAPAPLRERLAGARDLRAFAVQTLALPAGGSYTTYAETGRPYVTWSVVATPELSLAPRRWCFPVVGCVSYRGYFSLEAAEGFADGLRGEGLDVHVAGARAYSTLGWFDDPVLDTMMGDDETVLAGILFHELAHRRVYLPGDSAFSEAYAVAVERAGMRRWLEARARPDLRARYEARLVAQAEFLELLRAARERLESVYGSDLAPAAMRAAKASILAGLREQYDVLERERGRPGPYRGWFDAGLNNARLALVSTYHRHVPAFERLLAEVDGDLAAFHDAVEGLAGLPEAARHDRLAALALAAAANRVHEDDSASSGRVLRLYAGGR
jgi:predicted aminopeptidase